MKLKDIMKENPDGVQYKDGYLHFNATGAHPFGIYKNKAFIGDEGGVHYNIRQDLVDRGEIDDEEMDSYPRLRGAWKFPGRLWVSKKIISFWDFPKESQMKGVISKLEKATGKKIWKNGWKVEVIDKGGKIYRPDSRGSDEEEPSWDEYETGGNVKLIPVEDYAGSQKQVGKGKSHVVSPMDKKKKKVPKGMGSLKKVKGQRKGETPAAARHRLRKGMGDGEIKLGDLLLENPDGAMYKGKELAWGQGAFPFGMYNGKMYAGYIGDTHGSMSDDEGEWLSRKKLKYPGRIWFIRKVITFWEFPPKAKMKSVISKLEKAYKERYDKPLKIWNNGYKIEVVDSGGKIYNPKGKYWGYEDFVGGHDEELPPGSYITFIPLEDYEGSKKQIGKGKSHVVSPMIKTTKQVPKGMGSKKQVKGAEKDELPAAARHRIRKGLGDGVIKLKNLIKEIFILYEDQSDELVKIAKKRNGLVDPKGQVHAVPELEHVDWLVNNVSKFKSFKKRLAQANSNEWSLIYEAVINEAMSDGWVRISGRKGEIGFTATKKSLMRHKKLLNDIVIFAESVEKRPIKVYKTEFIIRKPQKQNYNKDFGDD
jgi:hypothetical protein